MFDIKNLTVGDQLKGASNSGGLYNGQVGMMVRTKTYVFAVQQSKGVLVIDPLKHEIIKLIEGSFSTLTQSKDGSVWVGAGSRLLCIDPETLEETYLSLPDGLTIPDSWYAWTAGVLCASTQENAIYWTKGGGFAVVMRFIVMRSVILLLWINRFIPFRRRDAYCMWVPVYV